MNPVDISLVIPTKDKLGHLRRALPACAALGLAEIIVVDSSVRERAEVEALCTALGAKYVFEPVDRLRARNLGAAMATGGWVAICDDDVIIKKFDLDRFRELAQGRDFMIGGWGERPGQHYAWIFRKGFFLDVLGGYDSDIAGGDDLDITLRAEKLGKGVFVFDKGLYESEAIGLSIAKDYPDRWIRNRTLYALTAYPLVRRHPHLIRNILLSDAWRAKRVLSGEIGLGRALFESFLDRAGTVYSPLYSMLTRRRRRTDRR